MLFQVCILSASSSVWYAAIRLADAFPSIPAGNEHEEQFALPAALVTHLHWPDPGKRHPLSLCHSLSHGAPAGLCAVRDRALTYDIVVTPC